MSIADKLIAIADNTHAVAETVNGAMTTENGTVFRIEAIADAPIKIQTEPGAVVKVGGKNLLSTNSVIAGTDNNKVMFNGMITGDFVFSCVFNYEDCKAPNAAQFRFTYTDNAGANKTASLTYGNIANRSIAFSGTLTKIEYLNWGQAQNGTVDNMQLEIGTTVTEYEPYKGVQTATADANGKVEGIDIVHPTMTIVADKAMECKYFPTSAESVYEKYQQLVQAETDLKENL
jgi:hypothetical protein